MVVRQIVVAAFMGVLLRQVWCCWEEERVALSQLRTDFSMSDVNLFLHNSDGSPWGKSADCCDWIRVECDANTRRVTGLDLYDTRGWDSGDLNLNASLFLPFKQLTSLDLGGNGIVSCLENEGFERLKSLDNLEYLGLSGNKFNNDILSSLSSLSSLKSLDLNYNRLKGKLYFEEFINLKNLRELNLDVNEIEELIPFSGGKLRLSNLKTLSLAFNRFNNNVLSSLEGIFNLEYLNLGYNQLGESFNITKLATFKNLKELSLSGNKKIKKFVVSKDAGRFLKYLNALRLSNMTITSLFLNSLGLCNLKHLRSLDLSYNFLGGLPWCLTNFTSLQYLDLSYNSLLGNISSFPLILKSSIQNLKLAGNYFQIPTSFGPFYNCSKLNFLDVRGNEFFAEKEPHNFTPKFQLQFLYIDGGEYKGFFPRFLYYQCNLQIVHINNNQIRGEFPFWLLENNTRLQDLTLPNISMSGSIKLPNHFHLNLVELDISNNYLDDQIPRDIGFYFPNLIYLNMSHNELNGSIPPSIGNIRSLSCLYLSNNQLSGVIPVFFGSLKLHVVDLSKNMLHGSLQNSFTNSSGLTSLDLNHNFLTGNIPKWIGNLFGVLFLQLGHNHFEGEIPREVCKLHFRLIDLSNNNLSGEIPSCLKCNSNSYKTNALILSSWIYAIEFTTKSITYFYYGKNFQYFSGVDLSCNRLTGHIPPELGNLSHIQALNLSHNGFRGPIPSTFSNLEKIESLDLSHNNLDGKIPPQLTQLNSIAVFTVAYNNLSGKTPDMVKQFATFENTSYEENPFLCGKPLSKSCEATVSPLPLSKLSANDEDDVGFMDMEVFSVCFVVSYALVLLGIAVVLYINPYWRRVWFHLVEMVMIDSYCFIVCILKRLFRFRAR